MIKNLMRAATAVALTVLPLTMTSPAHAGGGSAAETLLLADAIASLPVAEESRAGYTRDKFKHWNSGVLADGCNTRAELLISEAVEPPTVEAGCKLIGGVWFSYYDEVYVSGASGNDVDHMVPLAEAWDSGASQWTPARREAYANDLGAPASLVAVTARSNRSKADQDPSTWMPPAESAGCRYLSEWVATKHRWGLTVDQAEADALLGRADGCPGTTVEYDSLP
ncbi:HNH endonuclease family protein [Streptomyces gardneri]|uniref:HNH endonuclease family protein n=1 Tax=Streptomyces gardneri TaxID=66892 RepID=UPI0033D031FE